MSEASMMESSLSEADFLTIVTYIKGELTHILATASTVDSIKSYISDLVRYIEATEHSLGPSSGEAQGNGETLEGQAGIEDKANILKQGLAALFPNLQLNKESLSEKNEHNQTGECEDNTVETAETVDDTAETVNNADETVNHAIDAGQALILENSFNEEMAEKSFGVNEAEEGNEDESELIHDENDMTEGFEESKIVDPNFCSNCGKTFETPELFKKHIARTSRKKKFKCTSCCKAFKIKISLKKHFLDENHGTDTVEYLKFVEKLVVCPLCNKKCLGQSSLDKHMVSHTGVKPFQCCVCLKQFKQKRSLKMHSEREGHKQEIDGSLSSLLLAPSPEPKVYCCQQCDKVYTTQNQLNSHMKVHAKPQKFGCNNCGRFFARKETLEKHITKDCSGDIFPVQVKCGMCEEMFISKSLLDAHLMSHSSPAKDQDDKPAQPGTGSSSMVQAKVEQMLSNKDPATGEFDTEDISALANEIAIGILGNPVHPGESHLTNPNIPAPRGRPPRGRIFGRPPYQCQYCTKTFQRRKEWRNHQYLHTGEKPHTCDICGKTFRLRQVCTLHMATHGGNKYKCNICDKTYPYKNQLVRHSYTHSGIKPYKCEHCGKGFISKPELGRHYGVHGLGKTIVCHICGKSYRDIKKHMTAVHSKRQSVPCEICHKEYVSPSNLKIHMLTHNSTKTCICQLCGKAFAMNKYLSKHMILNHGEKKHKCQFCGKAFAFSQKLKMHERIHTGDKPYVCAYCGKRWADSGNYYKHLKIHRTAGTNYVPRKTNIEKRPNLERTDMDSSNMDRNLNIERNHSMENNMNIGRTLNMETNSNMARSLNMETSSNMERSLNIETNSNMDSNSNMETTSNMESTLNMDRIGYMDRIGLMDRSGFMDRYGNMERNDYMERTNNLDRISGMDRLMNMDRTGSVNRSGYMDRIMNMDRNPNTGIIDMSTSMARIGPMDPLDRSGIIDMSTSMGRIAPMDSRMDPMNRILKF